MYELYKILNVDINSNKKQIKTSFYKLAKKYHPDKNCNIDNKVFCKIKNAYDILYNDEKRKTYDKNQQLKIKQFNNHQKNKQYEVYINIMSNIFNYSVDNFLKNYK